MLLVLFIPVSYTHLDVYKRQSVISEKIRERTDRVPADYCAWLLLLLSDGLFIHQTLGNEELDPAKFIRQSEQFIQEEFL